jgi:hypothetical protein
MPDTRRASLFHKGALLLLACALLFHPARGGDSWQQQFKPRLGQEPQPSSAAPARKGRVTYTLERAENPTPEQLAAYERITASMGRAVKYYNDNTTRVEKRITAQYSPGTPTADGNINGSIRIGKTQNNVRVCLHEISHTVGIGTSAEWAKLVVDGVFTGEKATALVRKLAGDKNAVLHADRMHFWPYGLNFDSEAKSEDDFVNHCKMVEAICEDMRKAVN